MYLKNGNIDHLSLNKPVGNIKPFLQGESSIEKFGAFSHFVSQCRMNKDYTKEKNIVSNRILPRGKKEEHVLS